METETTNTKAQKKNIFNLKRLKSFSLKCFLKPKSEMTFEEWQKLESSHRPRTESAYMANQSYRIF
jgi:hypothetical protein